MNQNQYRYASYIALTSLILGFILQFSLGSISKSWFSFPYYLYLYLFYFQEKALHTAPLFGSFCHCYGSYSRVPHYRLREYPL